MPSSTSSFEPWTILKVLGTAAATIALAWGLVPARLPFDDSTVHGVVTLNELLVERYAFEHASKKVIVLGSSIVTMIPPPHCRPDDVASIYLQARGAMTGLEAILRAAARPEVVFVEIPTLMVGVDPAIVGAVFSPLWQIKMLIPPLRHNRNWVVMWYRQKIYDRRAPRFAIQTPTQSVAQWNQEMAAGIEPFLHDHPNDGAIARAIPELTERVRALQQAGSRIILFDPTDPRLRQFSPEKDLLARLQDALPDVEIVLAPDDEMPLYRRDGLHFHDASGLRFFNYLMQRAGIETRPKCELISAAR
jgi:hypothetical protein